MEILETQEELRNARHIAGLHFKCSDCGKVKPVQTEGGTGYGYYPENNRPICYACCAIRDKESMMETGRGLLYLVGEWPLEIEVVNWPGTLRFKPHYWRKGSHNIARTRYDVWFTGPDGKPWHGTQYGEMTQICRCRRIKG